MPPSSDRESRLANARRDLGAAGPLAPVVAGALAEAALGKAGPDLALVGALGEGLVGVEDGVAGLDVVGVAGLEGHTVHDELERQVLAVDGHAVLQHRHVAVVLAVLVDEVPQDLVQHRRPRLADVVHLVLRVERLVRVGVDRQGRRVQHGADALGLRRRPRAHRVVRLARVAGLQPDRRGEEVAPALAHAARLERVQAVGVGGAARQADRESVGVLVDDDARLKDTIALRVRVVPEVHPHAARLAVGGAGEHGVVVPGSVLSVQDGEIVALTALAVVVGLEVASCLVEAQLVKQVVELVDRVEQLSHRRVAVRGRRGHGERVVVGEDSVGAIGAVVVQVGGTSARVHLGDRIVALRGRVLLGAISVPAVGGGRLVPRVGESLAATLGRVVDTPGAAVVLARVPSGRVPL